VPNSPADKAGLKTSDVIIEVNGKAIKTADDMRTSVNTIRMGTKVTVKFIGVRDSKITAGSVDLDLPKPANGGISNESTSDGEDIAQLPCAGTPVSAIPTDEAFP